jgi:hypothetical protein
MGLLISASNFVDEQTNTAVILRCRRSCDGLEGWPYARLLPSFETPRKRAAPQDDGEYVVRKESRLEDSVDRRK